MQGNVVTSQVPNSGNKFPSNTEQMLSQANSRAKVIFNLNELASISMKVRTDMFQELFLQIYNRVFQTQQYHTPKMEKFLPLTLISLQELRMAPVIAGPVAIIQRELKLLIKLWTTPENQLKDAKVCKGFRCLIRWGVELAQGQEL